MKNFSFLLFVVMFFLGCTGNNKTNNSSQVVVCSYGGSYQEAQRKAFFEPFEKETGIKVVEANWSGEYGKLKSMVMANNVQWDLVTSAEASDVIRGSNDGILAKIDFSKIDRSAFLPGALTDYSQGIDYFSTVLAHRTDGFSNNNYPKNWKDFWDIEKFPGKRSLRKDPRTTLEIALLADGVPMNSLYPLDIDRAFKSLDKIKNSVIWWTTGSQPIALLENKQVVMASVFNGRV
jgi:putative spermidine/putrescine transport system substrate-binding protein